MSFAKVVGVCQYDYPIRQAISAFKHREDMTKLPVLAHVLRQLPKPIGCHQQNSVIVPMPTTAARLQRRGFGPVTIYPIPLSLATLVDSDLARCGSYR